MTQASAKRLANLHAERDRIRKNYGGKSGYLASEVEYKTDAIPTGWLGLDFITGIGGVPRNHQVEVFGVNDIGKSSLIGLNTLRCAQEMGLLVGVIAIEPGWSPEWAEKNGVDLDRCLVAYPDDGPDAFAILHDWVTGKESGGIPPVDYVLFDSIGALTRKEEATSGMPSAYGASNLITVGSKSMLMPCFKNNVGVMYLNQVRQKTDAKVKGLFESPGGEGLKHNCMLRIQLRPGGSPYREKLDGSDTDIGRPIIAAIKRNKLAEGSGQTAQCDYYFREVEGYPFGIDSVKDILDTGIDTGAIKRGGSWYFHDSFPPTGKDNERKLNGKKAVEAHFDEHPESVEAIRSDVMKVMAERVAEYRRKQREKKKVSGKARK